MTIKSFLINRARKKALSALIREIEQYKITLSKTDRDACIDLFNTGLLINLKTAGTKALDLVSSILSKEAIKRYPPSKKDKKT